MFNPLQAAKDLGRQRNQTKTTVVKVKEYRIDKNNPKASVIIAEDMYDKDQNGIPKTVEVRHVNEKTQGVMEFANRAAMMHTNVGGLIRLSQYRVDGNGTYLVNHMQRIAEDDGPKISAAQEKYDIRFMKAWTKVYPKRNSDNPGELAIFERQKRLFHKADIMVVPEDAQSVMVDFGTDQFEQQIREAVDKAIDGAPRGTQPMLLVRMKGQLMSDEIRLVDYKLDANKQPVPLTKEEIVQNAFEKSKLATVYAASHKQAKDAGETGSCEFVAGFTLNAIGMKWDGKSMTKDAQGQDVPNYIGASTIESAMDETAQRHALPKQDGETKTKWAIDGGAPQYSFGILSYRTKQVGDGQYIQSDLDTFGRDHGVKIRVSPNAGLDEKPNPYLVQQPQNQAAQTTQTNQAQEPANPPAASNQQAPAAQTTQAAAPEHQAAAPANQAAQTTQTNQVAQPNQGSPKIEETDDELPPQEDFGLEDFNIDMDELEGQLAHHQL